MQGSFVIFGGIYLLVVAVLFVPLRITARLDTTLNGGNGRLEARFLCLRLVVNLRIHLLEPPWLCIETLDSLGRVRRQINLVGRDRGTPGKWERALKAALTIPRIELLLTLGIAGEPAATALVCGAVVSVVSEVLQCLIPEENPSIKAAPVWGQTVCRINLEGIGQLRFAEIIKQRIMIRGEQ